MCMTTHTVQVRFLAHRQAGAGNIFGWGAFFQGPEVPAPSGIDRIFMGRLVKLLLELSQIITGKVYLLGGWQDD